MATQIDRSNDHALHLFLNLARRYAPLSLEEERELLQRCRRGDRQAVDRLVNTNLRCVAECALLGDAAARALDTIDLCAEGTVALVAAVRTYDPAAHGAFRPYVRARIRHAVATAQ